MCIVLGHRLLLPLLCRPYIINPGSVCPRPRNAIYQFINDRHTRFSSSSSYQCHSYPYPCSFSYPSPYSYAHHAKHPVRYLQYKKPILPDHRRALRAFSRPALQIPRNAMQCNSNTIQCRAQPPSSIKLRRPDAQLLTCGSHWDGVTVSQYTCRGGALGLNWPNAGF